MGIAVLGRACTIAMLLTCAGCDAGNQQLPASTGWTERPFVTYMSDFPVQQNLTEATAQLTSLQYIADTLRALPPDLSLGRTAPDNPRDNSVRYVNTCTLDPKVPDAPFKLQFDYWLVGGIGREHQTLTQLEAAWRSFGWRTSYEQPTTLHTWTPDHYELVAELGLHNGIDVATTSPCFPPGGRTGADPLPPLIPHP